MANLRQYSQGYDCFQLSIPRLSLCVGMVGGTEAPAEGIMGKSQSSPARPLEPTFCPAGLD